MGVAPSNRQRHGGKPPRHGAFDLVAFVPREAQTAKRLGDDAGAAGALALPVEQRGAGTCSGNPWHEWAGISPD